MLYVGDYHVTIKELHKHLQDFHEFEKESFLFPKIADDIYIQRIPDFQLR